MSVTTKRMVECVRKIRIEELNPHLVCVLCGGYYIDATTIIECLHSFCKTCIVRYLETSKYCPICDVQVHKTKPLINIRSDQTLQDLVYKLVPGLFTSEMQKRKEHHTSQAEGEERVPPITDGNEASVTSSDQTSAEPVKATKEQSDDSSGNQDERISLSLEYSHDGRPVCDNDEKENQEGPTKRYLLCPAAFTIGHVKKFLRIKFNVELKYEIDVFHIEEPLSDQYTLMDIAYIYTWRRKGPLRLFYSIFEVRQEDQLKRKLSVIPELPETTAKTLRPEMKKAKSNTSGGSPPAKVAKVSSSQMTSETKVSDVATTVASSTNSSLPRTQLSGTNSVTSTGTITSVMGKQQKQQQQQAKQEHHQQQSEPFQKAVVTKPPDPPVKRKVGRPPKNPKLGPKNPPTKPKAYLSKKTFAPLLKIATSQAKLMSSNAKSPMTQSKPFHLVSKVVAPPAATGMTSPTQILTSSVPAASQTITSSSSLYKSVQLNIRDNTVIGTCTSKSTNTTTTPPVLSSAATATSKPEQAIRKAESKPKCINTISNKLLASQQAAAQSVMATSPSKRVLSPQRLSTSTSSVGNRPQMSSQGTSPMSPFTTPTKTVPFNTTTYLSPGKTKTVSSPQETTNSTPKRPIKSCSSTQTGSPPQSTSKPTTMSVSVATSPMANKSASNGPSPERTPNAKSVKTSTPGGAMSPKKSEAPLNRNLFAEILGVKRPKTSSTTCQTTKCPESPSSGKKEAKLSPDGNKSSVAIGTKREATDALSISPPSSAGHRPHIAAAVAPTPPKRPYLPVASGTSGQITPPLRLKLNNSNSGAQGVSLLKSPTSAQAQGASLVKSPTSEHHPNGTAIAQNTKDKSKAEIPNSTSNSTQEVRGPEQEVPLDLGTRKSVPVT